MVVPGPRYFLYMLVLTTLIHLLWPNATLANSQKRYLVPKKSNTTQGSRTRTRKVIVPRGGKKRVTVPNRGKNACCKPPAGRSGGGLIFSIPINFDSDRTSGAPPPKPTTKTKKKTKKTKRKTSSTITSRGLIYQVPIRQPLRTIRSRHVQTMSAVAISSDEHWLAGGSSSGTTQLWDLTTGQQTWVLPGHSGAVTGLGFLSVRNRGTNGAPAADVLLVTAGKDGMVAIWSLGQRRQLSRFQAHAQGITRLSTHWKSGYFVTGGGISARLWNGMDGSLLATFSDPDGSSIGAVALSSDGKRLASGGDQGTVRIWNLADHKLEKTLAGSAGKVVSLAWGRPQSRGLAAGFQDGTVLLWQNVDGSNQKPQRLKAHSGQVNAMAVSSDGNMLATASADRSTTLWKWPRRGRSRLIRRLTGHFKTVRDLAFMVDDEHLVTAGADKALRLWELHSGKQLAELIALRTGWAVLTGSGFFDGNLDGDEGDRLKALQYSVNRQSFSMEALLERYYIPGLLGRILANQQIKPPGKAPLSDLTEGFPLPPGVTLQLPRGRDGQWPGEITVQVEARDQGGGIDEVRFFHNGRLVDASRRASRKVQKSTAQTGGVETIGYRVRLTNGINRFRAVALSQNDRIISEPATASLTHKTRGKPPPAVLHVLAVGINEYKNKYLKLQLAYSVPDATSIIDRFKKLGEPLFDRVAIHPLMDYQATREGIRNAIINMPGVEPDDTVVLYFAGHGITIDSEWYFLPWEINSSRNNDILRQGVPSQSLFSDIVSLPVQNVLLILDSCHSGGAVDTFTHLAHKAPLAKRMYATGIHVASASSSQQNANEVNTLGHGIFTQAILDGLKGNADYSPADRLVFVK